jgi:hypothetical protein
MRASESDDSSPHLGGRAQPGDVLGVETGGERTYVGDTSGGMSWRQKTMTGVEDCEKFGVVVKQTLPRALAGYGGS